MANTYSLIKSETVGSGGIASIVFSNIPQTFDDLILHISSRYNSTNQTQSLYYNSDTTNSNYNRGQYGLEWTGSSTGSIYSYSIADIGGGGFVNLSSYSSLVFASTKIYIGNYSSTTLTKTNIVYAQTENQGTAGFGTFISNRWNSTAAITSITLTSGGTFSQYSTASLYGIKSTV